MSRETPLEVLGLPEKIHSAFIRRSVTTVEQLSTLKDWQIWSITLVDYVGMAEIKEKLKTFLPQDGRSREVGASEAKPTERQPARSKVRVKKQKTDQPRPKKIHVPAPEVSAAPRKTKPRRPRRSSIGSRLPLKRPRTQAKSPLAQAPHPFTRGCFSGQDEEAGFPVRPERVIFYASYREIAGLAAEPMESDDYVSEHGLNPYLLFRQEALRFGLLKPEEEVALAQRIERGRLAQQKLQNTGVSPEDRQELEKRVQDGHAAMQEFVESNLRLVMHCAHKYLGRGLDLMDMIQEGTIGLMRAAERYDPRQGARFSTYSYFWIRQAITRACGEQSRLIRLPQHMCEKVAHLEQSARYLTKSLGRKPTSRELALEAGMLKEEDKHAIEEARANKQVLGDSLEKKLRRATTRVELLLAIAQAPLSLDDQIDEHLLCGGGCLRELFCDEDLEYAWEKSLCVADLMDELAMGATQFELVDTASAQELRARLAKVVSALGTRQARILELRYGLRDGQSRTLEEVGEIYGLTRERIRQIEAGALRTLRHPLRSRKLRGYLDTIPTARKREEPVEPIDDRDSIGEEDTPPAK